MLERFHFDFVRAGALLTDQAQQRYARVTERLAELTTRFGQNVLADEAAFRLELRSEAELAGLPEFVRAAARQAAADRGIADAHVITLSRSLIVPFLTFSERRDLREQAWRAWTRRGEHEGAHDNRPVAREILALRHEQARAHGYACYADYALADTMAGTRDAVGRLLDQVWTRAVGRVEQEREALRSLQMSRGESHTIEAWDWRWYAEKVRALRYELDEAEIKPYFPLERMVDAVFDCARQLFGLEFLLRPELRAYHPDVKVYEVRGRDGAGSSKLFERWSTVTRVERAPSWSRTSMSPMFRWMAASKSRPRLALPRLSRTNTANPCRARYWARRSTVLSEATVPLASTVIGTSCSRAAMTPTVCGGLLLLELPAAPLAADIRILLAQAR